MGDSVSTGQSKRAGWLLFFGFCCAFGWLGTNYILLTHFTNSRHFADLGAIAGTLLMSLMSSAFYAIIAIALLIPGLRRLKGVSDKKNLVLKCLIPAACLTPFLAIGGIAAIMMTPFVVSHARMAIFGPNVVQSQFSPDDRYEAYVVDMPSIDGPNHHLYVKTAGLEEPAFVTKLPEDVDYNQEILWSPYNDLVVFKTHFKLIAYAPATGDTQEIKLGGDYHWRKNGTFWVDYNDVLKPINFDFPEPGKFACHFEGKDGQQTLLFN